MERKELIVRTARKLIVENGLYDASIGKIAREAAIPVGSVYTYFKSKEELINEIFLRVKEEMNAYIFISLPPDLTEKEELFTYWQRAITFGLAHQEKFFFAEQLINSPLIFRQSQEAMQQQFSKTYALLGRGVASGQLKPLPLDMLHSVAYTHIVGAIKFFSRQPEAFTPETARLLFDTCWDGLKQ
jgi:AcrR family transcriptional regulator